MGISAPCQARVARVGIFEDSESIKLNQRIEMEIVTYIKRIVERGY